MNALSLLATLVLIANPAAPQPDPGLRLAWENNFLTVSGAKLPGGSVKVMYLEAYCRPGSTNRDWSKTVIPHKTQLVEAAPDGKALVLRCRLQDGVVVDHRITADADSVDFRLTATNPGSTASQAHWAQPCVRVDAFTGVKPDRASEAYLGKSFIYVDGKLTRLPCQPWATKALYVPGQVWCPRRVPREDVNPRPLSAIVPSNGLIGCFSADERMILASAWEPYQELFQGVVVCLHSDFRIGGLQPGETKIIRGKLYLMNADPDVLLRRYQVDFPEHHEPARSQ